MLSKVAAPVPVAVTPTAFRVRSVNSNELSTPGGLAPSASIAAVSVRSTIRVPVPLASSTTVTASRGRVAAGSNIAQTSSEIVRSTSLVSSENSAGVSDFESGITMLKALTAYCTTTSGNGMVDPEVVITASFEMAPNAIRVLSIAKSKLPLPKLPVLAMVWVGSAKSKL